ncbi:uncharacterized protein MONBRDRAFT_8748 [Monosiga brevicollis MX1]|uniref:Uncharacterized protein n=1 Tax=Monosiga brevicollis TaxID=81824 RepID=A9V109_MONBE|nr:uncharacterized protein MONBRDRAFT_8748 [Monosiga brevicollis MX1]EDQ88725.1 predicted protein [Monosiga brevicollis MX1]|eukprot:XP_001746338.1 hypothetical protein [Monosiga brevicollis MX1]
MECPGTAKELSQAPKNVTETRLRLNNVDIQLILLVALGCLGVRDRPRTSSTSRRNRLLKLSAVYIHSDETLLVAVHEARLQYALAFLRDALLLLVPRPAFTHALVLGGQDPTHYQLQSRVLEGTYAPAWEESFALARYVADNEYYPATIASVSIDTESVTVIFKGYEDEGEMEVAWADVQGVTSRTSRPPSSSSPLDMELTSSTGSFALPTAAVQELELEYQDRREPLMTRMLEEQTEYVRRLRHLTKSFTEPLLLDMTSEEHGLVFSNIEVLFASAVDYLKAINMSIEHESAVGLSLLTLLDNASNDYLVYATTLPQAEAKVQDLLSGKSDFAAFVHDRQRTHPDEPTLLELLRIPLEHVSQLQTLINSLLQIATESDEDFFALQQFQDKLNSVRRAMISARRESADQLAMHRIGTILQLDPSFLKLQHAGRKFLRQLFLFNDVVIVTQPTSNKAQRYVPTPEVPVLSRDKLRIDFDENVPHIYVTHEATSLLLKAETLEEKERLARLLDRIPTAAGSSPNRVVNHEALQPIEPRPRMLQIDGSGGDFGFSLRSDNPGYVGEVQPDGPAARAGLTSSDCVVSIHSLKIDSLSHDVRSTPPFLCCMQPFDPEGLMELVALSRNVNLRLIVCKALYTCQLLRADHNNFGVSLRGCNPVYVCGVQPGGPAEKAGLRLGDRLWSVEGMDIRNSDVAGVERALQKCGSHAAIVVEPTLRTLVVHNSSRGYGFSLWQPSPRSLVSIKSIHRDGSARHAGLRVGDQIWSINGTNVRQEPLAKLEALMGKQSHSLELVVISTLKTVELRRPVASTSYGFALAGEKPVRVSEIDAKGLADQCGIVKGAAIWLVNNNNALDLTHDQVVQCMRQRSEYVRLGIPL